MEPNHNTEDHSSKGTGYVKEATSTGHVKATINNHSSRDTSHVRKAATTSGYVKEATSTAHVKATISNHSSSDGASHVRKAANTSGYVKASIPKADAKTPAIVPATAHRKTALAFLESTSSVSSVVDKSKDAGDQRWIKKVSCKACDLRRISTIVLDGQTFTARLSSATVETISQALRTGQGVLGPDDFPQGSLGVELERHVFAANGSAPPPRGNSDPAKSAANLQSFLTDFLRDRLEGLRTDRETLNTIKDWVRESLTSPAVKEAIGKLVFFGGTLVITLAVAYIGSLLILKIPDRVLSDKARGTSILTFLGACVGTAVGITAATILEVLLSRSGSPLPTSDASSSSHVPSPPRLSSDSDDVDLDDHRPLAYIPANPAHSTTTTTTPPTSTTPAAPVDHHVDGVFANLMAVPGPEEKLPSYFEAVGRPPTSHLSTTVVRPASYANPFLDRYQVSDEGEFLVEGVPVGTWPVFAVNVVASVVFDFVGFMVTFFLATSHAAREGSRAGLGITLVRYGLIVLHRARRQLAGGVPGSGSDDPLGDDDGVDAGDPVGNEWMSYLLMVVGWMVLLK
ncbi:hypothetical protein HDU93_000982 [Gonapodya sp. JEL0774]|nr:hypothetical protein HDU93_000982 [Gonapodya sp. JEL0774]